MIRCLGDMAPQLSTNNLTLKKISEKKDRGDSN
jgi:hypothetical protein